MSDDFPRMSARTQRFTLGEPRSVTICASGRRVLFLRSASGTDARTGLWRLDLPDGEETAVVDPDRVGDETDLSAEERARRERVRETAAGVVAFSADDEGRLAVYSLGGQLHVVDVETGKATALGAPGPVLDPRIDPQGRRVAYLSNGALHVHDLAAGSSSPVASPDADTVSWGRAEHIAAEEMARFRGYWWAPDGESLLACRVDEAPIGVWWIADPAHPDREPLAVRYPAAGTANADVSLHVLTLTGAGTPVAWDRARFPYLARVHWSAAGPPLMQVVSRDQRTAQVRSIDTTTGETSLLVEDADPVWVEPFAGVPAWCGDRLVRIADRDDVRALVVGNTEVTEPSLRVRAVVSADDTSVVFTASYDDPSEVHVLRWTADGVEGLTTTAGVHTAAGSSQGLVVTSVSMSEPGARHVVRGPGGSERVLISRAERPQLEPRVAFLRLGDAGLPAGLVLPRDHQPGNALPILLAPYGGPHAQRVLASRRAWLESQWLADQGFAVLVVDGRGTPGLGPVWERAISRNLAAVLDDQVTALHAAARMHPDLDLSRVGIRGWSFGGYLAALAVLRRPDVFGAAVAGAPVTDWSLYDTFYTERYLGTPQDDPDDYAHASLLGDAASLSRPLLIIHGLADDNVVAAHTLLLSQLLTEHGRPHTVLPLTGVTHMTPQESVAENLLRLQVDFLRASLGVA